MTEANANDEKTGEKEDFSLGHSGGVASEEPPLLVGGREVNLKWVQNICFNKW